MSSGNQIIHLAPDDKYAHYNKGVTLKDLGQYEEAVLAYGEAIRLDPNYVEAHKDGSGSWRAECTEMCKSRFGGEGLVFLSI